jgi:phosphatidylinositol alpha-1,6-mannosyltransferase
MTLEYPPMVGGVAHYYANLVRYLPRGSIWVLDNAKGELLSTSRWLWPKWLKGLWNTYRAIRLYHIEFLLVGQVLPLGTIALILNRLLRIPYVVMTHGMDVTTPFAVGGHPRKQRLMCAILARASAITTVSTYTKTQLLRIGVPEEKIILVYPCANAEVTSHTVTPEELQSLERQYRLDGKRVMLSVGRLVERKGFDMVIAAMVTLHKTHPDLVYVIVGEGPYRSRLAELVRTYSLASVVHLVGQVSDAELATWYTRAACVVMPSRELPNHDVEGFGITFIEANSFGKPVIGGKSGGVVDAVIDGKTGFLVDPTDLAMLTKALQTVLTHPEHAEALGRFGAERVRAQFVWSAQAQKLEQLLSQK